MIHAELINRYIYVQQKAKWDELAPIIDDKFTYVSDQYKITGKQEFIDFKKANFQTYQYETLHLFEGLNKDKYFHIYTMNDIENEEEEPQTMHEVLVVKDDKIASSHFNNQIKEDIGY